MSIQHDIKTSRDDLRSVSSLVGDAMSQFAKLFQNEIDLAKAELVDNAEKLVAALGLIVAAGVLVIPAVVMLLFALAAALIAAGWPPAASCLVAAIIAAAISGGMFAVGLNRLKSQGLAPLETLRQLQKDKNTVKGMVR
jgi:hypothetical protein